MSFRGPAFFTPAPLKPSGCHEKMQKGPLPAMAAPTMRNTSNRTRSYIAHGSAAFFLARPVNVSQYRHVPAQPNSQPKHGAHSRHPFRSDRLWLAAVTAMAAPSQPIFMLV